MLPYRADTSSDQDPGRRPAVAGLAPGCWI